jgi:hypothetical protein
MIRKFDFHLLQFWVTQNTFRPVGLRIPHFGVNSHQPRLSRSGCVYNTPASKGYLKHFKAGEAAFTSFRRQQPPRPLLGRSGCVYNTPALKGHPKHF